MGEDRFGLLALLEGHGLAPLIVDMAVGYLDRNEG